jgi:acyl-CoA synthetase (AMP-forming)/AMP-acid ligase II
MRENVATVLEVVADELGDQPAVVQGETTRTWRELDDRAARLATLLAECGVGRGDRVAIALYNGPEYVESLLAAMKLRAVPVNVNYRYRAQELAGVLGDADASVLVMDASLTAEVARAWAELPRLRAVTRLGEPGEEPDPLAGRALDYGSVDQCEPHPRIERSGDDEWLMFTGGTTGRPKGVLSRHAWLFSVAVSNGYRVLGEPPPADLHELRAATRRLAAHPRRQLELVAAPLMHGTGVYNSLGVLLAAGTVVYLDSRSYDPRELARVAADRRVTDICLVGDVFARPLAAVLERAEAAGRPYDLGALRRIISVGVSWSPEVKQRLLRHCDARLEDIIAASEGGPFAVSVTTRGADAIRSTFELMPGARVLDEAGRDVRPGSGEVGQLAAPSMDDVRYLGDPQRSAVTFRELDGQRYCVPGDLARIEADGSVVLLGRGSRVINTGGEKVHAEEVEQVIAGTPGVADVLVVGVPDERWGQRIVAVVEAEPAARLDAEDVRRAVGAELAGYKKPRDVVFVPRVRRGPSGKADLAWARDVAAAGEDDGAAGGGDGTKDDT